MRARLCVALVSALLSTAACAPALNWREVQLGALITLLPCKPDHATRTVTLGTHTVSMEMTGCEAQGALYTISQITMPDALQAQGVMENLRKASLQSVQASAIHPIANSGDAQTSFDIQIDGKAPDGSTLQTRFKWLMQGNAAYQVAVYAPKLQAQQIESIVGGIRWQ